MTTRNEIAGWFDRGVQQGASHLVVVVDTFDYEDYPVFCMNVQEARDRVAKPGDMQRVMEVYKLSMDKESQLNEHRAYNI